MSNMWLRHSWWWWINLSYFYYATTNVQCGKRSRPTVLFYTAVPRTASTTMARLIKSFTLGPGAGVVNFWRRPFLLAHPKGNASRHTDIFSQRRLLRKLRRSTRVSGRSLVYQEETYFMDPGYKGRKFQFYSQIREPVDWFISRYFYIRNVKSKLTFKHLATYHPGAVEGKTYSNWLHQTLEDCVVFDDDRECSPQPGDRLDLPSAYFCGHDDFCSLYMSSKAMAKAKENVERFYPLVGLYERLNDSLQLLEESFIPLSGLKSFYEETKTFVNANLNKGQASTQVRLKLRKTLKWELDFYDFVKNKFADALAKSKRSKSFDK